MAELKILIISIGDELIKSNRVNTTAPVISQILCEQGWENIRIYNIADNEPALREVLEPNPGADIIIMTGGLGSTGDDNTIQSVTNILQRKLIRSETHQKFLIELLKTRQINDPNIINRFLKQADYPEGFQLEKNPYGSAGFIYQLPQKKSSKVKEKYLADTYFFMLPGVPGECLPLFENKILPIIKPTLGKRAKQKLVVMKIVGISESIVENELLKIIGQIKPKLNKKKEREELEKIKISYLPSNGEVLLQLRADEIIYPRLLKIRQSLKKVLSGHLIYFSAAPLSFYLHKLFIKHQLKVGFIESCTGGLLTSEFVQYAGSSKYLISSIITYAGSEKKRLAGVKVSTLEKHGEVSELTAVEMAVGHGKKSELDLSVSITGIAGPQGGSKEKPIGLVYLGAYLKSKNQTFNRRLDLKGNRNTIRKKAVKQALIFQAEILSEFGQF